MIRDSPIIHFFTAHEGTVNAVGISSGKFF